MALIKCPECGTEVSDKAVACPRCAYPIAQFMNAGDNTIGSSNPSESKASEKCIARIKLNLSNNTSQNVTVSDEEGNILWTGKSGQVAEIPVDGPTDIYIKYHWSAMGGVANGSGTIDPKIGLKYNVISTRTFMFGWKLVMQCVDVIDSD